MSPGSGPPIFNSIIHAPLFHECFSLSLSRLLILSLPDVFYQIILYTVPGAGFIIHFLNLIWLNLLPPKREYRFLVEQWQSKQPDKVGYKNP